jgi:hypothetical protein
LDAKHPRVGVLNSNPAHAELGKNTALCNDRSEDHRYRDRGCGLSILVKHCRKKGKVYQARFSKKENCNLGLRLVIT